MAYVGKMHNVAAHILEALAPEELRALPSLRRRILVGAVGLF